MKAEIPFWSVVVPLYNKQDYVGATLRSVLNQSTGQSLEVVVVDDGSTDAGPSNVLALADDRVRLVRQSNAGVAAARNRGIFEAQGRWVVFLDADDLLHPQALDAYEKLSLAFPNANIVGGKDVRVDDSTLGGYRQASLPEPLPMCEIENLPAYFVRQGMPFSSSSVAIKRQFLLEHGLRFQEGESMGEDLDLWLRASELSSIACTSAGLVLYRVGLPQSLMGSYRDLIFLPVWQRLRHRAEAGLMRSDLRASSLRLAAEMEVTLSRRLAKAARRREAWRHLWSAREAAGGHRWWVTLLALVSGSTRLVRRLR
jgi:glycosyltransferase involved in cell wall biosynthesis